ncbi:MAG: hypothetical protein L0387_29560 [Acidobacteria bacterium]|nr:hypothetical protein [Acidobacteriota bacterium]
MEYRAGVVPVMQFDSREYIPVVTVQQGKRRILVSSRALRSFMAARFAAGELYLKLAGMSATQKTKSPKAGKAQRAACLIFLSKEMGGSRWSALRLGVYRMSVFSRKRKKNASEEKESVGI